MKNSATDWVPGVEREPVQGAGWKSLIFALVVSLGLFCLLPLSEFIDSSEWIVREVDTTLFTPPAPPKTEMEKKIEKQALEKPISPILSTQVKTLDVDPLTVTLEVGPGDFKAAFALTNYNPAPDGYGQELVFALHDLDGNPNVIKKGILTYPPKLMRQNLEGEVKLLVLINEKGKVRVLDVVSSTHPDFIESSRKAAEDSIYQPPKRNGEPVKVQFYLPIRFTLLDQ
jgi:protein TonB